MEDIISVYRHCCVYLVMLSDWLAFFQLDLLEPDKTNPMKDLIIDNLTKVSHYTTLLESRPILSFS